MPIIHIRSLNPKKYVEIEKVLANLCTRVADELKLDESKVWATWDEIKPNYYSEGHKLANEQQTSTHPPFVEIWGMEGKNSVEKKNILEVVAKNLSELLKIDRENLFILYRECSKGTIFSGGSVV